jgi:hypothetical protein
VERLRNIANTFVPDQPKKGCAWAMPGDTPHVLVWNGWWESGNPNVALPQWRCTTCGQVTTDAPRARWFVAGKLVCEFNESDADEVARKWRFDE